MEVPAPPCSTLTAVAVPQILTEAPAPTTLILAELLRASTGGPATTESTPTLAAAPLISLG